MKYVYPAIFTKESTGYSIHFPDLGGCYTQGDDLEDGIEMAEDVLAFTLYRLERSGDPIPVPSDAKFLTVAKDELITLIRCDTMVYRKKKSNKAVKKTLTIPEWLNEEAMAKGVNFSQVLQDALMETIQESQNKYECHEPDSTSKSKA